MSETVCNQTSGQCVCRDHVIGIRCDQCEDGFWNITSVGCVSCNCDSIGSVESLCDQVSFVIMVTKLPLHLIYSCQDNAHVVIVTLVVSAMFAVMVIIVIVMDHAQVSCSMLS